MSLVYILNFIVFSFFFFFFFSIYFLLLTLGFENQKKGRGKSFVFKQNFFFSLRTQTNYSPQGERNSMADEAAFASAPGFKNKRKSEDQKATSDATPSKTNAIAFCPIGFTPSESRRYRLLIQRIRIGRMALREPQDYRDAYGDRWAGDMVKAAQSKAHGTGLFATGPIPAWSIVSFFPIEFFEYFKPSVESKDEVGRTLFQPTDFSFGGADVHDIMFCREALQSHYLPLNGLPMSSLLCSKNIEAKVYGDPMSRAYGQLGHLVNDPGSLPPRPTLKELDMYTRGALCSNSMSFLLAPHAIAIITTRYLASGEEILMSYGEEYWSPASYDFDLPPAIQALRHARALQREKYTQMCFDVLSHPV